MIYVKKLCLVAVLAVASVIWFPILAARGIFAVFNWMGQGMKGGMRHKDSGVMLVSFCGVIFFSPIWLVSIGAILALAAYEIGCFKLMNALYQAEDIGFHTKSEPEPPPQRRISQEPRPQEARLHQLPNNNQILSEFQARQVSLRNGWDPEEMQHSWDSRRQCWRSRDGQLVDLAGSHMSWAQ